MATTKVRDYAKLAKDIKDVIGEDNIISAAHCATRLRLVLKASPTAEVTEKISAMPAVIQVVEKGGQYQIVIGAHAKDVYEELTRIMQIDTSAQAEVKQSFLERVIATMSAVFAPFVYILAAAGLVQGCLILITQIAPGFTDTGTYSVLSFISWTPFTFLPVLIAVTASKHFKCNTYIAMWCCLALVNADWGAIASRISEGEVIKFLALPMAQTTYTSTVLPPLFLVLVLAFLERFLEKHLPDVVKAIGVPFLCSIIMVPATILVIGPVSDALANGIAIAYNWLYHTVPVLAALIVGGFWQVIVIFGVHWGVTPMVLADFNNFGCDSFQAFQTCAVVAQAAACFGVFLKSREKSNKNVALSAGITGIFGITEPAIYGVNLRLKKPFIAGCIGGAAGAIIVALTGAMYYTYSGLPGALTVINAIDPSGGNSFSLMGELIACTATIVITIVLIQFIGCGEKPADRTASSNAKKIAPAPGSGNIFANEISENASFDHAFENAFSARESQNISSIQDSGSTSSSRKSTTQTKAVTVYAPLNGEIRQIHEVNDPTFAAGILGQGAAIIPSDGKLYAPFDCKVFSVTDTRHAISLVKDDIEMLIHIGLDTVELGGKYYTVRANAGDEVKTGDLLIEFDLEEIKKNYDTITPILIVNAGSFASVEQLQTSGTVHAGDPILSINR